MLDTLSNESNSDFEECSDQGGTGGLIRSQQDVGHDQRTDSLRRSAANEPPTDAGLRDALSICETERARWKAKANSMEAAGNQHTSLVAEIDRLRGELRDNTDELAALTSERDALKVDTLSGKAKTTALRIIGGLAMKGYGMDIHADRLERIGEIVKDLQMSGADVTEKTLRMWIKEAAKVIEPPKKMA